MILKMMPGGLLDQFSPEHEAGLIYQLPSGNYLLPRPTQEQFEAMDCQSGLYGICIGNHLKYWTVGSYTWEWSNVDERGKCPKLYQSYKLALQRAQERTEREKKLPNVPQLPWQPMIWISKHITLEPVEKYLRLATGRW